MNSPSPGPAVSISPPAPPPSAAGGASARRGWSAAELAGAAPALFTLAAVLVTAAAAAAAAAIGAGRPAVTHAALVFLVAAAAGAAAHLPLLSLLHARVLRPLRGLRETAERSRSAGAEAVVRLPENVHEDLRATARAFERLETEAAGDRRRLREVAARAIRAQETERSRVSRQLQEETAQSLAALLFHLRAIGATPDAAAREGMLEEVRAGLSEVTDTVRRFARRLHPPALDELGVGPAVEAYAAALTERGGPRVVVSADGVRPLLGTERELSLFRILQEALANAVRHARASSVHVSIAAGARGVVATVEDDGCGFDVAATEARLPCLGLVGLRERALYAGGSASVESAPGRGTTVTVELPASAAAERPTWPVILPSVPTG
jgi:two-component system, NarL family, sensor histidine kinase UhpB